MYSIRAARPRAGSTPGESANGIARAAMKFSAAQAYGADARRRAPARVPSSRKSPNGSHQTRSLNRTSVNVRIGHSPPRTVATQPMGPSVFPRSPRAMNGAARSSLKAA